MVCHRVLVVEDDRDTRELVANALLQAGYEVQQAVDGADALGYLEKERYDVIITDYRMPRMDGLRLLAISRRRWPSTPVVLVSSEMGDLAECAVQQGAYAWMMKPYDSKNLLQVVRGAVKGATPAGWSEAPSECKMEQG